MGTICSCWRALTPRLTFPNNRANRANPVDLQRNGCTALNPCVSTSMPNFQSSDRSSGWHSLTAC